MQRREILKKGLVGLGGAKMDHVERRQREGLELFISAGRPAGDRYF